MEQSISILAKRPVIHLTVSECDKLSELAFNAQKRHPLAATMLQSELDRAELHQDGMLPDQTVAMDSTIEFVDEGNGTHRVVQLVYPHEADISSGRISILTPVGAGLIGMTAGSAVRWPARDGQERVLRIVHVRPSQETDSASFTG